MFIVQCGGEDELDAEHAKPSLEFATLLGEIARAEEMHVAAQINFIVRAAERADDEAKFRKQCKELRGKRHVFDANGDPDKAYLLASVNNIHDGTNEKTVKLCDLSPSAWSANAANAALSAPNASSVSSGATACQSMAGRTKSTSWASRASIRFSLRGRPSWRRRHRHNRSQTADSC